MFTKTNCSLCWSFQKHTEARAAGEMSVFLKSIVAVTYLLMQHISFFFSFLFFGLNFDWCLLAAWKHKTFQTAGKNKQLQQCLLNQRCGCNHYWVTTEVTTTPLGFVKQKLSVTLDVECHIISFSLDLNTTYSMQLLCTRQALRLHFNPDVLHCRYDLDIFLPTCCVVCVSLGRIILYNQDSANRRSGFL